MAFLTPCETCNRHVVSSDASCPFCGATVTATMRARKPVLPKKRLSRAAVMAFSTTVASVTAACGGSGDSNSDAQQPASSNTLNMNTGQPPTESMGSTMPSGTMATMPNQTTDPDGNVVPPEPDMMAVAAYGVPVMFPEPEPMIGTGGQPPMNPTGGAGGEMNENGDDMMGEGGSAGTDDDMFDPGPVPAYGIAPDPDVTVIVEPEAGPEPEPVAEPEPEMAQADAGAGDEPVAEPEPNPVALYGVTPLDSE